MLCLCSDCYCSSYTKLLQRIYFLEADELPACLQALYYFSSMFALLEHFRGYSVGRTSFVLSVRVVHTMVRTAFQVHLWSRCKLFFFSFFLTKHRTTHCQNHVDVTVVQNCGINYCRGVFLHRSFSYCIK